MTNPTSRIRVQLTRQGAQALFIGVFCLCGAVIRDLNLLVILAALVCGVMWVQWRMGRRNLLHVSGEQSLPPEAFVYEPFLVTLTSKNSHRTLSAHHVSLSEKIIQPYTMGEQPSGSCSITTVSPGKTASAQYQCSTSLRGRYRFGPLRIESSFPFGLLRCYRDVPDSVEDFVVFPRLLALKPDWRRTMQRYHTGGARAGQKSGSSEGQFFGLRAWQSGDSRRWIHWRTTARIGEIAVRQFEHPKDEQMLLIVDLFSDSKFESLAVERAVALAATILESTTRSISFRLALGIAGADEQIVAGTAPHLIRQQGLTLLAEARSGKAPKIDNLLTSLGTFAAKRWPLVVVSTRPRTANVWPQFAQRWLDQHGGIWVDVLNNQTHQWVDWSVLNGKS